MSLKFFHIFFITLSVVLAFGFSFWLFRNYSATGGAGTLVAAIATAICGGGLIVYGKMFLKKLKHVRYL